MKKLTFLLSCMIFVVFIYGRTKPNSKIVKNDSVVFAYLDSIKEYLDSLGVEEPIYVLAQASYESGWFSCRSCSWKHNNMFGFKGQSGKYLKFNTWMDCVKYYATWQKKRYYKYKYSHPKGTYLGFLKWCQYASGSDYNKKIQWTHDWIVKYWLSD